MQKINVDTAKKLPNVLSLCPGFRGLERGLIRAIGAINVLAYVEIEAIIVANLVAAMEQGVVGAAPIWSNVKTFNAEPFRGKVNILTGGYPCQPFSVAGSRLGTEDLRHLWPYIKGIIRIACPECCFFENVRGHLTLGFDTVYADLCELGYRVEAGIFSAEEVGAPHQRERLFILAIRSDRMANPDSLNRRLSETDGWQYTAETFRCSEEMANPNESGFRRNDPLGFSPKTVRGSKEMADSEMSECEYSINTRTGRIGLTNNGTSSELADTNNKRPQGQQFGGTSDASGNRNKSCEPIAEYGEIARYDRWPARPNEQQYEWEHPRTTKSGVGCTINGYNFREDLLRAYGNSVVEQTAEKAFLTLLQKHACRQK